MDLFSQNLPLALDRPLVALDTETTGADTTVDRVVQLALVRLSPDGARDEFETLVNPEEPIPAEATAIHGITDEAVRFAPPFRRIAPDLIQRTAGCDLTGFNLIRFDIPLLLNEFRRAGAAWDLAGVRILDAQIIYHMMEPRDLSAAYKFYCGKKLEGAHGALADTRATLDVLLEQIRRYPELPREVAGLDDLCNRPDPRFVDRDRRFRWRNGQPVFNFGEHKGRSLLEVARSNTSYLEWMLRKSFSDEVHGLIRDALAGEVPERGEGQKS